MMDGLISMAAAIETAIAAVDDWDGGPNPNREEIILKYFESMATVDAAPIIHAYWRAVKDGSLECTNCFSQSPHDENYYGDIICNYETEYCPYCGAKMDGEGESE